MYLLAAILSAIASLSLLAATRRARSGTLHRLQQLVEAQSHRQAKAPALDTPRIIGRILPRSLKRSFHLLGIEPKSRNAGLVVTVAGSLVAAIAIGFGLWPALILALAILLGGLMILNIMAARRAAELGALMPGFLDRVRQLLTIGNSLPTAFARAVHGAQPKLAAFFAPTIRRMGNGASFSDSLQQSFEDLDLYEMRLFAAAVAANMRFGGSLNHALNNLVSYLRKRSSIERELRANTAQIRASAWVLGLLPMGVAGMIIFENPDYARWFVTNPTGKHLLAYCIISQIIGAFMMRLVVKTKF
jgi:tight adherence protein B